MKSTGIPTTLIEVVRFFADERKAIDAFRDHRWPNGVTCPLCGCERVKFMESRLKWNCNGCKKQFSVKSGTVFEDSPIKLSQWLPAMWLICNAKNGISSCELARALGVTQKTAWFMLHRIRLAMQVDDNGLVGGVIEADETFIGGKARNMHQSIKERRITGTGGKDKTCVLGLLERGGRVRLQIVEARDRRTLHSIVHGNVEQGSNLFTDAHQGYAGLGNWFAHQVVDHAVRYVDGQVHTNGLENFWSLLKRGITGTYVSVEPFHLFRYLDEQTFRYNERKGTDLDRFSTALSRATGKRLTYSHLTGKDLEAGI